MAGKVTALPQLTLGILSLLFFLPAVYGITVNQNSFTNGLTSENLTFFSGDQNITRYLGLPMAFTVLNSSISIHGYGNSTARNKSNNVTAISYFWPFTDGNLTNQINGSPTFINTNSSVGNGRYAEGIVFNGSINETANINLTEALFQGGANWTYAAWYKVDNINNTQYLGYQVRDGGAYLQLEIIPGGNVTVRFHTDVIYSIGTVKPNTWFHVAVVANVTGTNRFYDIYINGQHDTQGGNSITINDAQPFTIGYSPERQYSANLSVDEIQFYNRVLDGSEIQDIYAVFPNNPYLEIGSTNDVREWNYTGFFSTNITQSINPNIFNNITSQGCTCNNCTLTNNVCLVPFIFHSDNGGILEYSNIFIGLNLNALIINEQTGEIFDIVNETDSARLFFDNNESFIDLYTGNTTNLNFSQFTNKLRFEFKYANGDIINRYIDTNLVENPIRICADPTGTTYFQQYMISATEKSAKLRSIFANCYVSADYTRFAYQDSFLLRADTIPTQYELTTYSEGSEIVLSNIDGSISSSLKC